MNKVSDPRAIIDRKELVVRLAGLAGDADTPKSKLRPKVLECLKAVLAAGRAEVQKRFEEQKASGAETVAANCHLIDQIIRVIHDFAVEHILTQGVRTQGEQIAIAAQGGYGRGELCPHSDIDLLFLLPTAKPTPYAEQLVEYILYMLWDLGLTVGHASRSVDDCLRQAMNDLTIRTALLEVRWLWGEKALVEQLQLRYRSEIALATAESFAEAKLAERDGRHERMGDSRYVLEPNIKEGKGGLRDLQTLLWIAKYLYYVQDVHDLVPRGVLSAQEARKFAQAQNFLWTVRCHLHYLTGREEDRLTFDVQPELAKRMGYVGRSGARSVERFMKHYFLIAKYVGDLTRIVCAILEESHKRRPKAGRLLAKLALKKSVDGFKIDGGRLNLMHDGDFEKEPVRLLSIFRRAQENGLDIHPKALGLITKNLRAVDLLRNSPDANKIFMEILSSPKGAEDALRKMNEAGVFGRFIPAFGRVVAQMQFDMYHVYTVDEHTIRAIGILNQIEQGAHKAEHPVAHKVIHQLQSRRALYAAALMHDIAKGRGGDHSELGAETALKLGPRLGLSDEETETVSWLIRHHLFMSQTAFKRDIDDPKTISDFVDIVQSPERLKLLLILTVADIRAVGPTVWNNWKAGLLRELYYRAEEMISGQLAPGEERSARVEGSKQALARQLEKEGWKKPDIEAHLARGYPSYWLSSDLPEQIEHARMIREAEANEAALTVRHHVDKAHSVTQVTIYTDDHPGLFSQIAGAMALSGASIVDAKIVTLANGMALDTFGVQESDGGPFEESARLKKLESNLERALTGRIRLAKELAAKRSSLPTRASAFRVPVRVILDNVASRTHTLIEVNGRDRPGFLYDVTSAITGQGLQISSAHISTYGERVVDVFYVKDIFGMKVDHEGKLKQLRKTLEAAIADPLNPVDPGMPSPPRQPRRKPAAQASSANA
jgi:[protein-PII] uridylyltransferase